MINNTTNALPAIGSYLVASWGYDQTNIDFYQVLGYTPSKKSVRLQRVQNNISGYAGPMAEHVTPSETPRGAIMTKRFNQKYMCATIDSCRTAFVWDGKPEFQSHYH